LLSELIHALRERPAPHKAAVLERWRDRPEYVHLEKLALIESALPDERAAAAELQVALQTLAREWTLARRTDELIDKERTGGLSRQELIELNELLKARARASP